MSKKDKLEGRLIIDRDLYRDILSLGTPYGKAGHPVEAAERVLEGYRIREWNSAWMKFITENHDVIERMRRGEIPIFKVAEIYRDSFTNEIIVVEVPE